MKTRTGHYIRLAALAFGIAISISAITLAGLMFWFHMAGGEIWNLN